ncbi:hypothetical protein FRC02_010867 [Tulasnella sp. 418]|nr:hypothetical protein FRC02_010867 [Tulasnella sp. 418]
MAPHSTRASTRAAENKITPPPIAKRSSTVAEVLNTFILDSTSVAPSSASLEPASPLHIPSPEYNSPGDGRDLDEDREKAMDANSEDENDHEVATPSSPLQPASPTPGLDVLLAFLNEDPYFLGVPEHGFGDLIAWVRDGSTRSIIAVPKEKASSAGAYLEPVEFCIVGQISATGNFLLPDGGWSETGLYKTPFAKASAAFNLEAAAGLPPFARIWDNSVQNVRHVRASAAATVRPDGILNSAGGFLCLEPSMKFSWQLFEKKNDDDSVDDNDGCDNDGQPTSAAGFSIDNWPVSSQNREHLEDIKSSHVARPFPMFSKTRQLISPTEYENQIGAVVLVYFTVRAWMIGNNKDKKAQFKAEVRQVHTLMHAVEEVKPRSVTIRKRAHVDAFLSRSNTNATAGPSKPSKHFKRSK